MPINLLSPQLLISSMEMGQLEPMMKDVDSIVPEIQMGGMNSVSSNSESQQLSIPNKQMGLMLEPVPDNPRLHGLSMTYSQMGQIANSNGTHGPQKLLSPSNHLGEIGSFPKNLESHQLLGSVKRKAPSELMSDNPATHQLSMLNKRVAHMEHRPWLQQAPAANRRSVQMESVHNAPLSPHLPAPNKRMVKIESGGSVQNAPGSPHLLAPNKKMVKMESFSGRSKMRESLAAALALVNQQQDKCVDSGSKSQGEAGGIQGSTQENPQPAADAAYTDSKEPKENFTSSETCSIRKSDDGEGAGQMILADATTSASALTPICDGKEFQSSNILRYEDVSFNDNLFVKDELLQGNGLSWVLDSEMEMTERKDIQPAEKQKLDHEEMDRRPEEQAVQSPEELASRIEAELFKLFGGVNKKYKEKGRSLLFNLKDRNNPELRERVMSGEIPPERLCSMTAEELASKELSEWRMAKAEELAQMVVLPDSEVDMRRLVKKTHKGEVEVEQYDSASVEVPVDTTSHAQSLPRSKEMEVSTPLKPDKPKDEGNASGEKSTTEDKTTQCTFTIPSTEATDFMQGLMVDDGLKDLPPIVSLDEFMESLDTEPPFEILPEKVTPISDKDDSETGSESKPSVLSPKNTVDVPPQKLDEIDTTDSKSDADLKTSGSHAVIKTSDHADTKSRNVCADVKSSGSPDKSVSRPLGTPKGGERVWNGSLQLNLSPMASVIGIYKRFSFPLHWCTALSFNFLI
ncbi:unnamed protein product [Prunus armeniaca]|uniref:TFIIS central domain-containing protein n=1 Tax=Prunus armeniaca TaxID=36596 RepID=A0A6J5XZ26_PRUAR|nr:unnamed protein product [Prunus armeniaca]